MIPIETITLIVGFLMSLIAFSLIIGDQALFRFGASLLAGGLAGWLILFLIEKVFLPEVVAPLIQSNKDWQSMLVPILFLLALFVLFMRLTTSKRAAGRAVLAVMLCAGTAITLIGAVNGTLINLYRGLVAKVIPSSEQKSDIAYWLNSGIILFGAVSSLFAMRHYVFFNRKNQVEPELRNKLPFIVKTGEIFIGVALGALFAGIFITSAMILIEQLLQIQSVGAALFQWVK